MTDHYFSSKPSSKEQRKELYGKLRGHSIKLITSSGIFSKDRVDDGTRLLIEKCHINNTKGTILDLGCGYGVIGITIKKTFPETTVICSDINERAVRLTTENAALNNVEITTIQSNVYEAIQEKLDVVLVNLPRNAGKEVCLKMIDGAYERLNKKGTLQVVAKHQRGGKTYKQYMEKTFTNCETIARSNGYHVYKSTKN